MITEELIEALNIGAADVELYGHALQSALSRAWIAAGNGDANALEDAIEDAKREEAHLRGTMLNVRAAMRAPSEVKALTKDEKQELIFALGEGQKEGFTTEDAEALVAWAHQARVNEGLLAMLLDHRVCASIGPDGDVLINLPGGTK